MNVLTSRLRKFRALFRSSPFVAARLAVLYGAKALAGVSSRITYSQTGEDAIVDFYLPQRDGFYVDVGANDPVKYSNTFNLYLKGWRGITIDANEKLVRRHKRIRPRDASVCAAVSDAARRVVFHRSESDLVSTIDSDTLRAWKTKWTFRPEDQIEMTTQTLDSILAANAGGDTIDLLCVDVEGHEHAVLRGLDFTRHRPQFVVIEIHDLLDIAQNPSYKFLIERNYQMVAYATMNAYFRALPVN